MNRLMDMGLRELASAQERFVAVMYGFEWRISEG